MSEEKRKPPVIELEEMLAPVSKENPSGESLRYSGLYDEILEARREDENLAQGAWKTELKAADYAQVINLAAPALKTRTKDLQLAAWLSEALVMEHGFAGLRDSLKLMSGLQSAFWETLFPEIDEGDMESRANAVDWMDDKCAAAVQKTGITQEGYGYFDYEDAKKFDIPDDLESLGTDEQNKYRALQAQAEKEKRVTADMWKKARTESRRAFYEELIVTIEECVEAYNELNRINEEKYDRNQTPGMGKLKKAFEVIKTLVGTLLEEKRAEEPDAVEETIDEAAEAGASTNGISGQTSTATASGAIKNRQDALKRLSDLAVFFQKTEPHSPVAYLIQRAVKWGNMPLESWLQDVIKDENIMSQLRQTLGLNTDPPESRNAPETQ